jgi:hypothetical protein
VISLRRCDIYFAQCRDADAQFISRLLFAVIAFQPPDFIRYLRRKPQRKESDRSYFLRAMLFSAATGPRRHRIYILTAKGALSLFVTITIYALHQHRFSILKMGYARVIEIRDIE